jgi:hypothetical protein
MPNAASQDIETGFDPVRRLALDIAGREAPFQFELWAEDAGAASDKRYTYEEAILMDWAGSKDYRKQRAFLEYARGLIPDTRKLELSGAGGSALPPPVFHVNFVEPESK